MPPQGHICPILDSVDLAAFDPDMVLHRFGIIPIAVKIGEKV
jgi:hypothetical protein